MHRIRAGFTTVELLIVVVVIAILAAITVVAYNGISNNAKNSEMLTRIDTYAKVINMYRIQHGNFPEIAPEETMYPSAACIGVPSDYPADSTFVAGECYREVSDSGTVGLTINASETLISQLSEISSTVPAGTTPLAVGIMSPTQKTVCSRSFIPDHR